MPIDNAKSIAKLVMIAETLATGDCEARKVDKSADDCRAAYPGSEDDWCLTCVARQTLEEYHDG